MTLDDGEPANKLLEELEAKEAPLAASDFLTKPGSELASMAVARGARQSSKRYASSASLVGWVRRGSSVAPWNVVTRASQPARDR